MGLQGHLSLGHTNFIDIGTQKIFAHTSLIYYGIEQITFWNCYIEYSAPFYSHLLVVYHLICITLRIVILNILLFYALFYTRMACSFFFQVFLFQLSYLIHQLGPVPNWYGGNGSFLVFHVGYYQQIHLCIVHYSLLNSISLEINLPKNKVSMGR